MYCVRERWRVWGRNQKSVPQLAVKVVHMKRAAEHRLDPDHVQHEAQMLGKINHTNIVHHFGRQSVGSQKDPLKALYS